MSGSIDKAGSGLAGAVEYGSLASSGLSSPQQEGPCAGLGLDNSRPTTTPDLMQLTRLGELQRVQTMISEGRATVTDVDQEGATALHWAASYNHYALCKYLLDQGADVNAVGGESKASACLWAAHKRHYYIVGLFLRRGADTSLLDLQGFNMLHLSTFSNAVLQATLLLHFGSGVDAPDSHQHTALMWAAYNGFPQLVTLYLRWGARVDLTDESGSTALHWALVKGDFKCVQKLVEYGADRFAVTVAKKTPEIVAQEMHTEAVWTRALESRGYRPDGHSVGRNSFVWSYLQRHKRIIPVCIFLAPIFMLWLGLKILGSTAIFIGLPLSVFTVYSMITFTGFLLKRSPSEEKVLPHTSFLAGVFAASLFWVGVQWVTRVLPGTLTADLSINFLFLISFASCSYFYFMAMLCDPGYLPLAGGVNEQRLIIEELLDLWKYDPQNFCVHCLVRKPLRSKHCFRCKRCVAKHDHHCPWINTCVAVNNHRHFVFYVISMEVGMGLFLRLAYSYLYINRLPPSKTCYVLSPEICGAFNADPFTTLLSIWTAAQMVWATMLIFVQIVQIARAMTTYENMKSRDLDDDGGPMSSFVVPAITAGAPGLQDAQLSGDGLGPDPALPTHHTSHAFKKRKREGWLGQWTKLLGVDTFVATAQDGLDRSHQHKHRGNPFSYGIIRNLRDFFADPSPLFGQKADGTGLLGGARVDYTRLYELPLRTRMASGRSAEGGNYVSVSGDAPA